jgi:hypothetical protein
MRTELSDTLTWSRPDNWGLLDYPPSLYPQQGKEPVVTNAIKGAADLT